MPVSTINDVADRRFIDRAIEHNGTTYADIFLRREDLWENAREKMAATIEALTAWSRAMCTMPGGPSASDLCELLSSVCTDSDMEIVPESELADMHDHLVTLQEAITAVQSALKKTDDPHAAAVDCLNDYAKFDVDFGRAMEA